GGPDRPRPGFTLGSNAASAPACAAELDQAALVAAATSELGDLPVRSPRVPRPSGRIVVVGGGIVGLTVALLLGETGRREVLLLDAAPAGRTDPAHRAATFRGADAHHLSLTETLPHATASRREALHRPLPEGGWLTRDPRSLDPAEQAWAAAFAAVADRPGFRALAADLAVGLNRFGLAGWEALLRRRPDAFTTLRVDRRPSRLYLSAAELAAGLRLQSRVNAAAHELDAAEVHRRWPALGPEATGGGVVEVDGMTVNAHAFAGAVRDLAAASGVRFRDSSPVRRLHARPGGVDVELADRSTLAAASVVVAVDGPDLADLLGADARSAGTVQQVLGVFVTIRNPGLHHPLKVHAPEPLGVVNLTLSPDGIRLHAAGGFGFLGLARPRPGEPAAEQLAKALEDLLGRLFPGPLTVLERRYSEYPMTPDGLPVVEAVEVFDGRVVVAGGTNAGGTVQAPVLARLVELLLDGEPGLLHQALHPDRGTVRGFAGRAQ
ncbi:FAD-dependent oxidoreductase, partial [Dactylosporangium sp. NPDC005572]|uniref:NAD(P)/FAD-dependent oxidoreductase n=1 Tax=Dactylosporangium sp. NPDC005572 TaxID=3156889 RepID=UPI0033BCD561